MSDIKPCPSCGGKAELFIIRTMSIGGYYVGCLDCHKKTALYDTSEDAIAIWNMK